MPSLMLSRDVVSRVRQAAHVVVLTYFCFQSRKAVARVWNIFQTVSFSWRRAVVRVDHFLFVEAAL